MYRYHFLDEENYQMIRIKLFEFKILSTLLLAVVFLLVANLDRVVKADNIAVSYSEDGKYFTEDDVPTFNIGDDGTVDWHTYSGFRRYHSDCHVCHGPDGEGSTYAPGLKASAVDLDYYDFIDVVVNGRQKVSASQQSVMPAFGDNLNVMCFLDDIYVYLKARGAGALGRGRPAKKEPKNEVIRETEQACMGN